MGLSTTRKIFEVENFTPTKLSNLTAGSYLQGMDLSFAGHDTQHATHVLHPYVAAINPPLARALIQAYFPKGASILDPYCGGGGVLVEAVLNGHPCSGGDINPLAVILSKAKTTYIQQERILEAGCRIKDEAKKIEKKINLSTLDPQLLFWFKEKNLRELTALGRATKIVVEEQEDIKPALQTILSATIRNTMLTYRGEVRLRKLRPEALEKFNPNTFALYDKKLIQTAERVGSLPRGKDCKVGLDDIRNLPYKDNEFYGIVCSPPYADDKNGIGYFQFSKNMLSFLGFDRENLKQHRQRFHGMDKMVKEPPKSQSLTASLENVLKNNTAKYNEAVAFYSDYADALKEMQRVVKKWIIIVVGNRVLARTAFNNAAITADIFESLGVSLHHHYTREINKKRIPNLGGDGGGINLEHVLVFKK